MSRSLLKPVMEKVVWVGTVTLQTEHWGNQLSSHVLTRVIGALLIAGTLVAVVLAAFRAFVPD